MLRNSIIFFMLLIGFISCKEKCELKLPFYSTADFTPQWFRKDDPALASVHTIPSFSFIDQNGNRFTNEQVKGKIFIADFFFTRCAGICPKMTNNMSKVCDVFKYDTSFAILSHSVTPEYDSPEILRNYAKEKNINAANWHLLTGEKTAIYSMARRGYFAEMKDGYTKDSNEFLHTENFILVDKHGRIRGIYNGTLEVEVNDMIEHVRELQREE